MKGALLSRTFRIAFTGVATGLSLLAGLVPATSARAADPAMAELLKILRERGSLSEAEYEALSKSAGESAGASASEAAVPGAAVPTGAAAGAAAASTDSEPKTVEEVAEEVEVQSARIDKAEQEIEEQKKGFLRIKEIADGTSSDLINKALEGKWYERISIRGYTQFRVTEVLTQVGPDLDVPTDRSVRDDEMFTIRRGRLVVSGDATEHLFLYAQADFNAFIGSGEAVLQMRDLYGDIALDPKKEFRLRFGVSKTPFGFTNLQSSQNRAPMERADGINSEMEGERDYGAYLMWSPADIRLLFKDIVKRGLKGSGDYGVVAFGLYNGQGSNKSDQNHQPHVVGRVAYPFQLANGQIMELGAQYYWGRYVTNLTTVDLGAGDVTPDQPHNGAMD
jgi:hypothetical protein